LDEGGVDGEYRALKESSHDPRDLIESQRRFALFHCNGDELTEHLGAEDNRLRPYQAFNGSLATTTLAGSPLLALEKA